LPPFPAAAFAGCGLARLFSLAGVPGFLGGGDFAFGFPAGFSPDFSAGFSSGFSAGFSSGFSAAAVS